MAETLVKRLLDLADYDARAGEPLGKCMREAAARIRELEAERDALRGENAELRHLLDLEGYSTAKIDARLVRASALAQPGRMTLGKQVAGR